jgi:hypothetical protein
MYQITPLLLALALLMPWTGPADPGNRIAAANAADGLAAQALIYHQAALAYVALNPGTSGAVSPDALPTGWAIAVVAACAKSGGVATYVTVPTTVSSSAVASAMGRLWGGYPLVGQAQSSKLTNPFTGAPAALPCAIPNGAPVILSQAGG